MTSAIGKLLLGAYTPSARLGQTSRTNGTASPAYKTASYASIPYERAPQVTDTVPTKGLLPGYATPEHVWVC